MVSLRQCPDAVCSSRRSLLSSVRIVLVVIRGAFLCCQSAGRHVASVGSHLGQIEGRWDEQVVGSQPTGGQPLLVGIAGDGVDLTRVLPDAIAPEILPHEGASPLQLVDRPWQRGEKV